MYLGPHHFQAQSRYFEDSLSFAADTLWFQCHGLSGCALDPDAIANGTVSLLHARGIFPDGLAFQMPECDRLPAPLPVAGILPPTRESVTIHLTVPVRREGGRNCMLAGSANGDARFLAENRFVQDECTGVDERPVNLGRKNLRLAAEDQLSPDLVSLPLGRILRDGSGRYIYDPRFIPPCTRINASTALMLLVRRLIDILEEKSASLGRSPEDVSSGNAYSARDLAGFWLLHAVNAGLAPLRHLWTSKRGHPEELYLELSRLAGALCTFSLDSQPRSLPAYDHDNLTDCFERLDRHIRSHLEIMLPTNCLQIPLQPVGGYFWQGDVSDQRTLGRAQWIFAIRSNVSEPELIGKTPQLVKVCSSRFVPELVKRALPGLVLTHMPVPPPAISRQVETQYFSVSRTGPCWEHIVQTRQVGIYVPGDLPAPELSLQVILEESEG
jgi:type VI secretion system protein ImpJ